MSKVDDYVKLKADMRFYVGKPESTELIYANITQWGGLQLHNVVMNPKDIPRFVAWLQEVYDL